MRKRRQSSTFSLFSCGSVLLPSPLSCTFEGDGCSFNFVLTNINLHLHPGDKLPPSGDKTKPVSSARGANTAFTNICVQYIMHTCTQNLQEGDVCILYNREFFAWESYDFFIRVKTWITHNKRTLQTGDVIKVGLCLIKLNFLIWLRCGSGLILTRWCVCLCVC